MAFFIPVPAVVLEPKGRFDVPFGCGSLSVELCDSVQWSVAYTLFAIYMIYLIYIYIYDIYIYIYIIYIYMI